MATSSDQVHGQQYVDFDEYIDIQLRKTGSTIKTTDVMTAVVGVLTLVTLYLLVFVIFDHWIVPGGFGAFTRGLMLAVVASAAGAWMVWKVLIPWQRRVSGLYAASTIEKASPALKSSLLNLVDISRSGHEVSPEIYQSIERRAALALSHVDVNETVDRRSLLRLSNALLAVVVIFCLYWVFSPKNPATSLWRAIVPSAEVGVATRTEIFNVHPGDKDVLARSQLEVTADIRGEIPAQTFLYFTTADRKFVDERVEMRLENEGTRKFRCVLTGDNGGGILQNLSYRIVAGDATTPEYSIRVVQPPSATIDSIRLDSPEYTRREPVTQTTAAIDALEGTRVTLKAHANMPLRSASLQFFDDETASKRAEEIPIRVIDGTKLEVDWKLEIRSDGTYPHYYRIFCTSTAGESDPSPSLYSLAIRPDQPPEIILRDPKTDLDLPANAVLPLLIEAHDPDFALTYIDLNIEKDGSPVNPVTISERTVQQLKTTYKWSLRDHQFHPKDTITYWLQAKDNRQPIANVTRTPKLRIHIIDAVPEKQVKKDLADAEKHQKDAIDKSDGEQPKQDQADNEKTANNRDKKQQPPGGPKDRKQADAQEKPKEGDQQAEGNDRNDDQSNGGPKGDGQQSDKPDGTKGPDGQKEKNAADKDDKQPTNPDDSHDDAKTLQKLLDQERREREKQNKSPGAGQGDKGAAGQNKSDQNKPDKNSPSQDKKDQQQPGSSSDSPQTGNEGQKKPGEGDSKNNPSSGSKPNETKDQSQAQKDSKGQSPTAGNEKTDSNGTKPQGDKPSESSKKDTKSGAGQDSKTEQKNGGDNGSQQGPKNGSSDGSPDAKNQPDKKDARGDEKSKADKQAGTPNQGQPGDKNSEDHKGQKQDPSENKPAKSGNQDGRPDPKQPPGNQDNTSNAGNDSQGPKKGSDGQSQSGNEGGDPKTNDAKGKNDPSQSQSPTNDGKPTNPKNGDQPGQNDASNNQSGTKQPGTKEPGTKQSGSKDPDAKENATKEPGSKQPGGNESGKRQPSKESGNNQGDRSDANQQRKSDQKGDASQKTERGPKQPSDEKNNGNQNNDRENKQRSDKSDVAPNDDTARPNSKSDDRRRDKQDDASSPRKNRTPEEDPLNSVRDKKHAGGAGSEIDPSRGAEQKEGTTEQQPRQRDAQQKDGGQQQQQPGGTEGKAGGKQQAGAKPESSDSKPGDGKPGDSEGGKQEQSQQKPGQDGKGQSGKGQEGAKGQDGKGQEGQSGAGQKGQDGQSNAGQKGTKPGAGTGQSNKGNNGGGFNNGDGPGEGAPLEDTTNQANPDYAKKATNLVLQRLEDQLKRGKIDKKIEEELGWNQEQVRRFVERMRKQAQAAQDPSSPASEARRLQFEETLKSLDLRSPAKRRSSDAVPKTNDSEIEKQQSIPPAEYRDLYEAYTKSLAKPVPRQSNESK